MSSAQTEVVLYDPNTDRFGDPGCRSNELVSFRYSGFVVDIAPTSCPEDHCSLLRNIPPQDDMVPWEDEYRCGNKLYGCYDISTSTVVPPDCSGRSETIQCGGVYLYCVPRPTASPSSSIPTEKPSLSPSTYPSNSPSDAPSCVPTRTPTTDQPSMAPSMCPTTEQPTLFPTSDQPSVMPSLSPSTYPSNSPSGPPSFIPTRAPTTDQPSRAPSMCPSTERPTLLPTSDQPSVMPSLSPSTYPSVSPSGAPSCVPTRTPTTDQPSRTPSMFPTTERPTLSPSSQPSIAPTSFPSSNLPSNTPSCDPTSNNPTTNPTIVPTSLPTSDQPSCAPSHLPTSTHAPTAFPTMDPTRCISRKPTRSPSLAPIINVALRTEKPGICSDRDGLQLQGWSMCITTNDCSDRCVQYLSCNAYSYGDLSCNDEQLCIMHEQNANELVTPPTSVHDDMNKHWRYYNGSNDFYGETPIMTANNEHRSVMSCGMNFDRFKIELTAQDYWILFSNIIALLLCYFICFLHCAFQFQGETFDLKDIKGVELFPGKWQDVNNNETLIITMVGDYVAGIEGTGSTITFRPGQAIQFREHSDAKPWILERDSKRVCWTRMDEAREWLPIRDCRTRCNQFCGWGCASHGHFEENMCWHKNPCSTLFFKLDRNQRGNKGSFEGFKLWLKDLSHFSRAGLVWKVFNFVTDVLFLNAIYGVHNVIFIMLTVDVSLVYCCICLLMAYDVGLYLSDRKYGHEKERRRLKLRWTLLVFIPLENIVMIAVIVYLYKDSVEHLPSYITNGVSIVFFGFFKAFLDHQGFFDAMSQREAEAGMSGTQLRRYITSNQTSPRSYMYNSSADTIVFQSENLVTDSEYIQQQDKRESTKPSKDLENLVTDSEYDQQRDMKKESAKLSEDLEYLVTDSEYDQQWDMKKEDDSEDVIMELEKNWNEEAELDDRNEI